MQLKPRLINILMNAIQVETDPQNTHMLLGGLMLCVQDSALFEESTEINADTRQTSPAPSDTNLLSSGMRWQPDEICSVIKHICLLTKKPKSFVQDKFLCYTSVLFSLFFTF